MRTDAISLSLGLEGFTVLETRELGDSVHISVELEATDGVCPRCGHLSTQVHDRTDVRVHDVPLRGMPTYLVWHKRRYRCLDPECELNTFTERHREILPRARTTRRFRAHLGRRARTSAVSQVATEERASWWLVWRSLVEAASPALPHDRVVTRLGIDEASFRRGLRYHTAFVDLDRNKLLDLVPDRTKHSVIDWVSARPVRWRESITHVVIDPFDAYRVGVASCLSHARLVVDKFHAVRLANLALDATRRRLQRQAANRRRGRRSRSVAPSRWTRSRFGSRRLLVKAQERLSEEERLRLERTFEADATGELRVAWDLKERFREWYLARNVEQAHPRLARWYADVERAGVTEFIELAATVRSWEEGLLAHFGTGATNGPTEGITNLVKVVKRQGFGYRNFENFRIRVLYRCG